MCVSSATHARSLLKSDAQESAASSVQEGEGPEGCDRFDAACSTVCLLGGSISRRIRLAKRAAVLTKANYLRRGSQTQRRWQRKR